ncbi:site-specific DNA-methyltransferase [Pedobacter cryotolerans]|uniref:site-specific DNA-methyltransferase (adenine-specific) n=1 Tax=Pedobacter cryotolerans TaxID=2571270 RepID=A0A4U1CEM1_9SPHI|nr:site-specific DNA-methyltransferase [Pedobacter cryotolerans]
MIKDNEIDLNELKAIAGLPIDEKVNGYGLNFIGRNFARAKYAQKTEKEVRLNTTLSKNIDTTENLVLKGDNLDSLKILKSHYSGKIKCIYIDPPYNTANDEFVYPDKFDKEEAEVLGLANLSESDFARMDFSFKTKKSHNGWLAFMYPRLLLARDLLSKDGVIFISIDDNEQANLKLLCDEIFGEENFIGSIKRRAARKNTFLSSKISDMCDLVFVYSKTNLFTPLSVGNVIDKTRPVFNEGNSVVIREIDINTEAKVKDGVYPKGIYKARTIEFELLEDLKIENGRTINKVEIKGPFRVKQDLINKTIYITSNFSLRRHLLPEELDTAKLMSDLLDNPSCYNENGSDYLNTLFESRDIFSNPKPVPLIEYLMNACSSVTDTYPMIILDFFAGSGTTGEAVMEMNKDGGNRKFILCQIDEQLKKDTPSYKFCIDNNLPPVISSITIERLNRAGEKIAKEVEEANSKTGLFEENKKQVPDIGFKVFDRVEATKLKVDEKGQISITENEADALSRIYNMIFTLGLDEPTQVPEMVIENRIYKIGNHYYITNSEHINSDDYSNAIKNGKVFIDGWSASLNGTLQNYKEDVKIVF